MHPYRTTRETMTTNNNRTIRMIACERCVAINRLCTDNNPTGSMFIFDPKRQALRVKVLIEAGDSIIINPRMFDAPLCEEHEIVSPTGIIRLADFNTLTTIWGGMA